jgi:hypothetical protein
MMFRTRRLRRQCREEEEWGRALQILSLSTDNKRWRKKDGE